MSPLPVDILLRSPVAGKTQVCKPYTSVYPVVYTSYLHSKAISFSDLNLEFIHYSGILPVIQLRRKSACPTVKFRVEPRCPLTRLAVSTSALELAQVATRAECIRSAEVSAEGFSFVDTCKYMDLYVCHRS